MLIKKSREIQRKRRTRVKINKTSNRPRLSVFRSNRHIFAQIIDDTKGKTMVAISDKGLTKDKKNISGTKINIADAVGLELAKKAKAKKISKVTFDKGAYKYHGRIKALAEGARKGGLEF